MRLVTCSVVCGLLSLTTVGAAQSDADRAAARSSAQNGVQAFEEGDYEKALERLESAESVVHAPTHLLFIARSHDKLGDLVGAQEAYLKLSHEKLDASAPDAFRAAQDSASEELEALKPRIPLVTIDLGGKKPDGLEVEIDGAAVSAISLGVPTPTNPGNHEVIVRAAGYKDFTGSFVATEGGTGQVDVVLVAGESSAETASAGANTPEDAGDRAWQRPVGWAAVGLGGVGIVAGVVTGLLGTGEKNDLDCEENVCTPGTDLGTYNTLRTASMVGFVAGGVLAAGGVTLLLTAPKKSSTASISPYVGFTSVGVTGRF